jgi:N-acetylmuramoyl-L-alanine amidase
MSLLPASPLLRLALACGALVALVFVVVRPSEDGGLELPTADRTTSTTAPSVFGPVPTGGSGVVRTDSGAVLPVTGGSDGRWEVMTPCARTVTVEGDRVRGAHVVIDPGHGGTETGAIATTGVTEAELNLDVARRTARHLEEAGATVVLTRQSDLRVTIATRAAVADALEPLAFISIHHNSGPTSPSERPGVQVFHQTEEPEAERLASLTWAHLMDGFAPFADTWSSGDAIGIRARLGTDGDDYYGVLRRPEVPSVLVEALYLSGEPEADLLADEPIREAEAEAIADAVTAWVGTEDSGGGQIPTLVSDESSGGGGGTGNCTDPPELQGG